MNFVSFLVWVWVFCKSLANFQLDNLKWKEKFLFLSMELSINFNFFLISKIDSQIHTQKINFFYFFFFIRIWNLQEICKILKLKYTQNSKHKPKLKPLSIFGCICMLKGSIFRSRWQGRTTPCQSYKYNMIDKFSFFQNITDNCHCSKLCGSKV